jgi:thiopurine S-methyltransferase
MEASFWLERWELGQIGFHQDRVHPDLQEHVDWLAPSGERVLVPLAGKTWDLPWLARRGTPAVGVELAEKAVRALMDEHAIPHEVHERGAHQVFVADDLQVWCGDFFAVPAEAGPFAAVWDRAALVALSPEQRGAYVDHVRRLAPGGRLLLNVLEYDQALMSGPPFSVSPDVVRSLYGADRVELVAERDVLAEEPRWRERGHEWFRTWLFRICL